jgi:hypothetical protein
LKTWLRLRISEHRLTGLVLLHVLKNIIVSIDEKHQQICQNEKKKFGICYLTTYQPYVFYLDIF